MVVNEVGAALIGVVIGWVLMFVLRRKTPDWKEFGGVVTLIVGGSTLTYLVQSGLLAYFWIGIFAGFFANIIAKVLSKWIPNLDPSTVTR